VTRLRFGLESGWKTALESGGYFTPRLEIGMRHDGGDAETGFGVELGGGISWNDPQLGLNLNLEGRTLVTHAADDFKDRGFAASLVFDPDPATERGPSFSVNREFGGQASGGLSSLFESAPLDKRGATEPQSRSQAQIAYGFAVFGGQFTGTPHLGLGLASNARDYTVGWRMTPESGAPDISFEMKATRSETHGTVPDHAVGFEVIARW